MIIDEPNDKTYKITRSISFLPTVLYELVLSQTDLKKQIIEEQNSELWYETYNGDGTTIFNNKIKYIGNITFGILETRTFSKKEELIKNLEKDDSTSTIEFPDGTIYKGTVHNNEIDGSGTFVFPTGSTYKGEVKKGLRHGFGVFENKSKGVSYTGEWKGGVKHGRGKMIKPSMIYEGEWKEGKIHGRGKLSWISTNDYYDGNFNSSLLEGNGFMIWDKTSEKYCGGWKKSKQEGIGIHIWYEPKGERKLIRTRYVGEWKKGKRDGFGIFYYANGSKYEGYWKNDKKEGFGTMSFLDRKIAGGIFKEDRIIKELNLTKEPPKIMRRDSVEKAKDSKIEEPNRSKELKSFGRKATLNRKFQLSSVESLKREVNREVNLKEKMFKKAESINRMKRGSVSVVESSLNTEKERPSLVESSQSTEKEKPKEETSEEYKVYLDLSDIIEVDDEMKTHLRELDNILLRNLSDITRWYRIITIGAIRDNEMSMFTNYVNESNTKSLISLHQGGNLARAVEEEKKQEINHAQVYDNDLSFCMELKDLWKFMRDAIGVLSYEFTPADIDRFFFRGPKNYYEMFYLPENLASLPDSEEEVYKYIAHALKKEEYDFCCKYHDFIGKDLPKKTFDKTNPENRFGPFSIHNRNQVILLRHFYEVLVRVAYFRTKLLPAPAASKTGSAPASSEETTEDYLKNLCLSIKTMMKIKKKSVNFSKADSSSISSHSDMKRRSIETQFEGFLVKYEHLMIEIFDGIYFLSTDCPSQRDRTIRHRYLYRNYLRKIPNKAFKSIISPISSYLNLALSISTKNITSKNISKKSLLGCKEENSNSAHQDTLYETYVKYANLLDSEMIFYEFCELVFHLGKKFLSLEDKKEEDFSEVIQMLKDSLEEETQNTQRRRKNFKGKDEYIFPKLKAHYKIEERERRKKFEEEERKRKHEEKLRYEKERKAMINEDINMNQGDGEDDSDYEGEEYEYY